METFKKQVNQASINEMLRVLREKYEHFISEKPNENILEYTGIEYADKKDKSKGELFVRNFIHDSVDILTDWVVEISEKPAPSNIRDVKNALYIALLTLVLVLFDEDESVEDNDFKDIMGLTLEGKSIDNFSKTHLKIIGFVELESEFIFSTLSSLESFSKSMEISKKTISVFSKAATILIAGGVLNKLNENSISREKLVLMSLSLKYSFTNETINWEEIAEKIIEVLELPKTYLPEVVALLNLVESAMEIIYIFLGEYSNN